MTKTKWDRVSRKKNWLTKVQYHREEKRERAEEIASRLENNWVTCDPQENDLRDLVRMEVILQGLEGHCEL